MKITNVKNRVYVRECINNNVYHAKDWMLYPSLKRFFKTPPEIWRDNDEFQLYIAWIDSKPVGILLMLPWIISYKVLGEGDTLEEKIKNNRLKVERYVQTQIYVKSKYRNNGIASKLIQSVIDTIPEVKSSNRKFIMHYAGDNSILKLREKFPEHMLIIGTSEKDIENLKIIY